MGATPKLVWLCLGNGLPWAKHPQAQGAWGWHPTGPVCAQGRLASRPRCCCWQMQATAEHEHEQEQEHENSGPPRAPTGQSVLVRAANGSKLRSEVRRMFREAKEE
jgi:hypothetical protein